MLFHGGALLSLIREPTVRLQRAPLTHNVLHSVIRTTGWVQPFINPTGFALVGLKFVFTICPHNWFTNTVRNCVKFWLGKKAPPVGAFFFSFFFFFPLAYCVGYPVLHQDISKLHNWPSSPHEATIASPRSNESN